MTYENLSIGLQDILIYQYESMVKYILFFLVVALSIFYLFYWKKNVEKPTPFFGIGIVRIVFTVISQISLVLFPLGIMVLAPNFSATTFYSYYMLPYMIFLLILLSIVILNFIYYAPQILFKMAGADLKNKKINQVYQRMKKYAKKHQ